MKSIKILWFLAILLSAVNSVTAQEYNWGISMGLNYSKTNLSKQDTLDQSPISGVSGSFLFDFEISKFFRLQPEIRYSQNEMNTIRNFNPVTNEITETGDVFNRLEIPVLLKLKLGGDGLLNLLPYIGFIPGYNLSAFKETRSNFLNTDGGRMSKYDIPREEFDDFSIKTLSGIMIAIKIKKVTILTDYRIPFGFNGANEIRSKGLINTNGATLSFGLLYNP